MKTKKIVLLSIVALLAFFLLTQPTQSANVVGTVLEEIKNAAEAIVLFIKSLFS